MADSIQLTRQVAIRTIVTENFKTQVSEEIARNLQQIETEMQQMEFRVKRAIADLEKKQVFPPQQMTVPKLVIYVPN